MKEIKAILFDCDGTLVDTEEISAAATVAAVKPYGIETNIDAVNQEFIGIHLIDILETLNKRHSVNIEMDPFLSIYTPHMVKYVPEHIRILPDTVDYICSLKERGYKLTVGSNGVHAAIESELRVVGLCDFFDIILTADDVPNPKPAPDMYLEGMKACGINDPESCLVVEDSVTGIKAAIAGGFIPIGYTGLNPDPKGLAIKLKEAGASQVISRLQDLDFLLK